MDQMKADVENGVLTVLFLKCST